MAERISRKQRVELIARWLCEQVEGEPWSNLTVEMRDWYQAHVTQAFKTGVIK